MRCSVPVDKKLTELDVAIALALGAATGVAVTQLAALAVIFLTPMDDLDYYNKRIAALGLVTFVGMSSWIMWRANRILKRLQK